MTRRTAVRFAAMLPLALASCADGTGPDGRLESCPSGGAMELAIGEVLAAHDDAVSFCIEASQASEYILIPFLSSPRDTALRVEVTVSAGGLDLVASQQPQTAVVPLTGQFVPRGLAALEVATAFEGGLRDREEYELTPRIRGVRPGRGIRKNMAPSLPPPVGSTQLRSVAARCDGQDLRTGRVAAVSDHAVVLADIANPAGGFSDAEYVEVARKFDEDVYPLLTAAFGAPTDLDGNGRVVLFFTRGVNEIAPPGGTGIVAGFFWSGDMFPRVATEQLGACEGSNEGEIIYLAVPDPAGAIRGIPADPAMIRRAVVSTIGHELQHLLNSGRRLHINGAEKFEEKWLNEALSFVAEEMLFYRLSGLSAGRNLGVDEVSASPQIRDAFNDFAVANLGRYNIYLQAAPQASAMGVDVLATRGAAWAFLRYVADRAPGTDTHLFSQLVNARTAGLESLAEAIGADPLDWMRDWSVAVLTDDFVGDAESRYAQPSWNYRELLAALRVDGHFPLRLVGLTPGSTAMLQPGSALYSYFGLAAGTYATLSVQSTAASSDVRVQTVLVRIR